MKLKQLLSFVIAFLCIVAFALLTVLTMNKHLPFSWYIFLMAVTGAIAEIDVRYLSHQFVNGEWVESKTPLGDGNHQRGRSKQLM